MKKILFITSNRVGDAVLSTGILAALAEQHPDALFTVVCGRYAADLFLAMPQLEQLLILNKKSWNRHWLSLWTVCIEGQWDLVVDLRNSLMTRFLRASKRLYRGPSKGRHKVVENAAVLGINPPPAPHIWLDDQAIQSAAEILPQKRPLLALGPAANWPPKQWPVENFAALAQRLTAPDGPLPDATVLVFADTREQDSLTPLFEALPGERCIPVIGQNLLTVAACLKECALFIGNDSGLMHMAAAMHTPTLGLFGPGFEKIYGPWGTNCAFVRTPESRTELLARLPKQPGVPEPNLMQGLTVDKAFEAAIALLQKTDSPA